MNPSIQTSLETGRHSTCAIGVMAKAPQIGRSKTRLCPPLSPVQAANLSAAFLRDTTSNIVEASRFAPIVPYAAFAPEGTKSLVAPLVAEGTRFVLADGISTAPKGVEGFGRCLLQALEAMLEQGHAAACLLSSDIPTLPTASLVRAAEVLLQPGERGVLGACHDGGYYLLGLKSVRPHLFADIVWSTDTVAEATRERAREIELDLVELEPWYDVDDAGALERLLTTTDGFAAPATRAVLAELGLMPRGVAA